MKREVVTREYIESWLTDRLRQLEDCADCVVSGIQPLQKPDIEGCNWSDSLIVKCGGVPFKHYGAKLSQLVDEARQRFNLC